MLGDETACNLLVCVNLAPCASSINHPPTHAHTTMRSQRTFARSRMLYTFQFPILCLRSAALCPPRRGRTNASITLLVPFERVDGTFLVFPEELTSSSSDACEQQGEHPQHWLVHLKRPHSGRDTTHTHSLCLSLSFPFCVSLSPFFLPVWNNPRSICSICSICPPCPCFVASVLNYTKIYIRDDCLYFLQLNLKT